MDVILMHRLGTPKTMQRAPKYENVVADVRRFFEERIAAAQAAGIRREQLLLDPGLGFGKELEDQPRAGRRSRRASRRQLAARGRCVT